MKLRLAPLAAMVAGVVSAVVPAAADRMPGVDAPEALAAATALGNTYVGWNVHIPQPGYFQVSTFGASGTGATVLFIRLDDPRVIPIVGGGPLAMVGAAGVNATLPVPVDRTVTAELLDGEYAIVATASSGPASAARFVLSGPPTADVTGSLRGPTFVFTDADFGAGPALVAPGVDQRPSIHGEVRVTVQNRLFASWSRCPDSTHTVQGPPAATGWPWATSAGVLWGHPGTWTFKLDASANRLQPGSLEAPCTNHLVGFDLVIPDSAIPQR